MNGLKTLVMLHHWKLYLSNESNFYVKNYDFVSFIVRKTIL